MTGQTHRGFIEQFLDDGARLARVLREAQFAGIRPMESGRAGEAPTPRELLKGLLNALESSAEVPTADSPDLVRLHMICAHASALKRELTNPELWRTVLQRLGLAVPSLPSVEVMATGGRNSYLYRVRWGESACVARYLDPLGREFLSRHEPRRAIAIYCAVEDLFRTCLGRQQVVTTLAPPLTPVLHGAESTTDEDNAPPDAADATT